MKPFWFIGGMAVAAILVASVGVAAACGLHQSNNAGNAPQTATGCGCGCAGGCSK